MKKIIFAIAFFFLSSQPVLAAGIGVTPKSLEVNQLSSDTSQTEIFVHNTGEGPAKYEVRADEWSKLITAEPKEFRLEGGEARAVTISFSQLPEGQREMHLSVIAHDLSEEVIPKTGVKIPVKLEILPADIPLSTKFYPYIIGLLLLALVGLLLAVRQYQKWSRFRKAKDQLQEAYLKKRSKEKLAWHYITKHSLLVLSMFAVILSGIFLAWSYLETGKFAYNAAEFQQGQVIQVELEDPLRKRVFSLETKGQKYSAFTALQEVAEMYTIPLEYDPPNELGVYVTMLGGFRNGEDQKYWVYEIDHQEVPIAADKAFLQAGEVLTWKFILPNSN
jgi:hypothetical protein